MSTCNFCNDKIKSEVVFENDLCYYVAHPNTVLEGSGMIITKSHRQTVFDMTQEEVTASFELLKVVKSHIDKVFQPQGYNVGWNCYEVGGQTVDHVHMHVIPRFSDEPLAGKGIRHHLKQTNNRRISHNEG